MTATSEDGGKGGRGERHRENRVSDRAGPPSARKHSGLTCWWTCESLFFPLTRWRKAQREALGGSRGVIRPPRRSGNGTQFSWSATQCSSQEVASFMFLTSVSRPVSARHVLGVDQQSGGSETIQCLLPWIARGMWTRPWCSVVPSPLAHNPCAGLQEQLA